MPHVASAVVAVSGLLVLAGCAAPQTEQARAVAVEPGTATKVGSASQWNAKCEALRIPTLTVVEPPKNGTTEIKQTTNTLTGSNVIGSNSCAGREVEGAGLFYTSAPGFHGTDHLRYTAYLPGSGGLPGNTLTYSLVLTVK